MTGQRSTRTGSELGLVRAGFGPGWSGHVSRGEAIHVAHLGSIRARFQTVGVSMAHGRPRCAGPWIYGRVHGGPSPLLFAWAWSSLCLGMVFVHWVQARVAGERNSPASISGALLPVVSSPASSYGGAGVQLRWGKAPPRHGDCDGGVGPIGLGRRSGARRRSFRTVD